MMKMMKRRRRRSAARLKFVKKVFSSSTIMISAPPLASASASMACSPDRACVAGLPVLRGYVAARRGEREEMQDAHVLLPDMGGCLAAPPHQ